MPTSAPMSGGTSPGLAPGAEAGEAGRASRPRPPRRVLVVGPSGPECARLGAELAAAGLEVHACRDLDAAEEATSRVQPGLILARWDGSPGGGPELLRRLASGSGPTSGWIPVILHGGATPEERVAALDLGAFDVLATDPAGAELLARVRAGLRLRARMDELERRAYRDGLTGLINRGALEDHLRRHWEASHRHGTSLSVLIVDLDRLKEINDAHGHAAGDDALRRTAAVLSRSVRGSDVVARYGGDEFVVVAPSCPPASAVALAVRFRAGLADEAGPRATTSQPLALTLSVGIAGTDGPSPVDLAELLRQADEALYLAKRSGRDAVARFELSRGGPRLVD